jgi:hypothetical protein
MSRSDVNEEKGFLRRMRRVRGKRRRKAARRTKLKVVDVNQCR